MLLLIVHHKCLNWQNCISQVIKQNVLKTEVRDQVDVLHEDKNQSSPQANVIISGGLIACIAIHD